MLVIKIEIWPYGDADQAREIGRAGIANVSSLTDVSDYLSVVSEDGVEKAAFLVRGHRRADGFWPLLERVARGASRPPGRRASRVPLAYRSRSLAIGERMWRRGATRDVS